LRHRHTGQHAAPLQAWLRGQVRDVLRERLAADAFS
jgi:hypothetical protein